MKKGKRSNILVGLFVHSITEKSLNEILYGVSKQMKEVDLLVMHSGLSDSDLVKLNEILDCPTIQFQETQEDGVINITEKKSDQSINFSIQKIEQCSFSETFNTIFNAANDNEYEFFSVIEQEDILSLAWYNTATVWAAENPNIHAFMPILRNTINNVFNGFINEACWADGMAEEAGKTDVSLLLRFSCLHPLGGLFRTDGVREYSESRDGKFYPMKNSFKITHYYEFFLRMVYNDLKFMTVPRIGYEMRTEKQDVFYHSTSKIPQNLTMITPENGGMTMAEAKWWMESCKKEYFFDADRNKTYEKSLTLA